MSPDPAAAVKAHSKSRTQGAKKQAEQAGSFADVTLLWVVALFRRSTGRLDVLRHGVVQKRASSVPRAVSFLARELR